MQQSSGVQSTKDHDTIEDFISREGLFHKGLALQRTPDTGRGVFVQDLVNETGHRVPRLIKSDVVLHQEDALCSMAATALHCDCCRNRVQPQHRAVCSHCQCVVWCADCASSASFKHAASEECIVFAEIDRRQSRRGVPGRQFWLRFTARAILAAASRSDSDVPGWRTLLGLHTVPPDKDVETEADAAALHASLLSIPQSTLRCVPTTDELNLLLVAVGSNAIAIHAAHPSSASDQPPCPSKPSHGLKEDCEMVAWALFRGASMFNHSCRANACWTFEGVSMTVHSTQGITSPEEVFVSYLPLVGIGEGMRGKRQQRQAALINFGFCCRCSLCEEERHQKDDSSTLVDIKRPRR